MSFSAAAAAVPLVHPLSQAKPSFPNDDVIKRRLLRYGVAPTPKILHAIRKKELQKSIRRFRKKKLEEGPQEQGRTTRRSAYSEEEARFSTARKEYRAFKDELEQRELPGRPWERRMGVDLRGIGRSRERVQEGRMKKEHLEELREMLAERKGDGLEWLLDDDLEEGGDLPEGKGRKMGNLLRKEVGEDEKIGWLVERLTSTNLSPQDWKFPRLMKRSGIVFTEMHLLRIVEGLGLHGSWRHALAVVEWVYNEKEYKHHKSRFVYTKLLAVLGKARRPDEALRTFNFMREDGQIYPDMPAYHSIAVTLGQAGLVKELINIVECMRRKPSKLIKCGRDWDPCLEPDVVVYNAVLNACVPTHQWKGVFWVLEQMRHRNVKPTGATYGLAMEVMLKAGKYDLVHKFFERMHKSGMAPKAITFKVLVRSLWEEGKVDEAVAAVRDMECRGVVGTASVYYELACCLCNNGRWQDAVEEVEKLKKLPLTKPLEVTFTGMIFSAMEGGHILDSILIFEHMKGHCTPNIGAVNAMLKVYGRNDMFAKAKELFESTKNGLTDYKTCLDDATSLKPDEYSYSIMLEASASAHQWEYFEYLYKEMALCRYQLDYNKYDRLLVEASRAGKLHLLEHGFDMILEAGKVPQLPLFSEMICQTIAQQKFERAVSLLNGMAYASIQVSENQWRSIFQRDKERLTDDKLQKLLDHLNGSNLVMEEPVPAFLQSLQSLCGLGLSAGASGELPSSNACTDKLVLCNIDKDGNNSSNMLSSRSITDVDSNLEPSVVISFSSGNCSDVTARGSSTGSEDENDGIFFDSALHVDSGSSITDMLLDSLTANRGKPSSELPSASQILEAWKEDRMKNGLFHSER